MLDGQWTREYIKLARDLRPKPWQAPAPPIDFVGRAESLVRIKRVLRYPLQPPTGASTGVCVITGMAGAGKTGGRPRSRGRAGGERAASIFQQVGDPIGAAQCLRTLGEALTQQSGRTAQAERAFVAAAELFDSHGHGWGLALTELSLGEMTVWSNPDDAQRRLRSALRYWTDNAVPALQARTLVALGTCAEESGDPSARQMLTEAYELYQALGAPTAA